MTGTQLLAETVLIRGGEHDGFTRLVLDLPGPLEWSLENGTDGYRVTLFGIEATFDTRETFSKITTSRVSYVRQVPGTSSVVIGLGCDCSVRPELVGNRMLAIDVLQTDDGDNGDGSTGNRTGAADGAPSFSLPVVLKQSYDIEETAPLERKVPSSGHLQVKNQAEVGNSASQVKRVSEQLMRAQRLGLLPNIGVGPEVRFTGSRSRLDGPQLGGQRDREVKGRNELNFRIRTGADVAGIDGDSRGDVEQESTRCIPSELLRVGEWGGDDGFAASVGRLRSGVVGEFDRVDADSAAQLVRFYIHYGFGAEALLVLRQFEVKNHDHLATMADILEFGLSKSSNAFEGMVSCENPSALWALLSDDESGGQSRPDENVILRSLNELPVNIRNSLVPLVSKKLVSLGMAQAAEEVVRLAVRGGGGGEPGVQFSDSVNKLKNGKALEAEGILSDVSEMDAMESPLAMIELVKSRVESRAAIDFETAQLVGAMAQEWADSAHGAELAFASILAFTLSEAYPQALSELRAFESLATPEMLKEARSFVYSEMALGSPSPLFLSSALAIESEVIRDLSDETVTAISKRLIELGFPVEAVGFLDAASSAVESEDGAILRARAALELGQPDLAQAVLVGVLGSEADLLRARSMEMNGDYVSARRMYNMVGKVEKAEALEALADAQVARAGGRASSNQFRESDRVDPAQGDILDAVTLESSREVVVDSETTRGQIGELLGRYSYD